MKARIKWGGGASFICQSDSGHEVITDGPEEYGGKNLGPRPMELLLLGAGSCSSFDVVLILQKSRQQVDDCYVEIEAERADKEPKVFTKIHMHFVVSGKDLEEKKVARAIELSATRYCSASIMLGKTADITHDFEIRQGQG
ncbi:MAG: OsmC family protein [Gammaproteobacteria bacterium]|nr:MAG: OsmC family protein [Gammaproteobacteria bacterium]